VVGELIREVGNKINMFQSLANLVKDPKTKKALIIIGVASGVFLMVKSYHEIKLTKLRIKQLEEDKT